MDTNIITLICLKGMKKGCLYFFFFNAVVDFSKKLTSVAAKRAYVYPFVYTPINITEQKINSSTPKAFKTRARSINIKLCTLLLPTFFLPHQLVSFSRFQHHPPATSRADRAALPKLLAMISPPRPIAS